MSSLSHTINQLNSQQKKAVNAIYGPLLVIAGPGTGKTQLLSARVANILQQTDTLASNILCLTFTESGAKNLRDRLQGLIGDAAYDATISTYHSFASEIITTYNQYFQQIGIERSEDVRLERPIDELTQIQIVEAAVNRLAFDSPLLSARYYVKSVVSTISDLKQHLISPDDLRSTARKNISQIDQAQPALDNIVNSKGGISRKRAEALNQYARLYDALHQFKGDLIQQAIKELAIALQDASEANSTKPVTAWKNVWLHKNESDEFTLTERLKSQKMNDLANIYDWYQQDLKRKSAYDFDDMILRAIEGIKNNQELRFNLQERYQFILLDEFQDTNPSQFDLVKHIADHPVHEGRPNVMAVGDDDQAIFAFQGANVGNMKDFLRAFNNVAVVNLTENYRSHTEILHVAHNIASQIEDRLHAQIDGVNKILTASSSTLPKDSTIARHEFASEANEYAWVARKIADLQAAGIDLSQIAVLAPKHAILANLVPFLSKHNVPISYEKRENILQTEIVQGLKLAAQLLDALQSNDTTMANHFFPMVLSLPFWNISAQDIWQINWQHAIKDEERSWAEIALTLASTAPAVSLYLAISTNATIEPLEVTLDKLSGTTPVNGASELDCVPLGNYYFDPANRTEDQVFEYYQSISHISVIRAKLREYQQASDANLTIQDFLQFFAMYEAAEASLINVHPIAQQTKSVQLMTAYKAKGLEFDHVFILQAHDDVWGSASKGGNNKVSLPANLSHIRYAGSSDDERLRLLFVAITRSRHSLYITSHTTKDSGKPTSAIRYMAETDGTSPHLPKNKQAIIALASDPKQSYEAIETLWQANKVNLPADFKSLLAPRLQKYRMSPTHLNAFLDVEYGGPESFLVNTLLRFPQAPGAKGEYGTAVHNTLEWYQNHINNNKKATLASTLKHYDYELSQRYMSVSDRIEAQALGRTSLQKYITNRQDMFSRTAQSEVNFYSEGVKVGDALLTGKIDRLEVDTKNKTVRIVDYKTGTPLSKWSNTTKAYKYKQQLYFYKLLIEHSTTWRGYDIIEARLEFVEPNTGKNGDVQPPLILDFDTKEEAKLKQLIQSVWSNIMYLDLPDTTGYAKSIAGIKKFEKDLLKTSAKIIVNQALISIN